VPVPAGRRTAGQTRTQDRRSAGGPRLLGTIVTVRARPIGCAGPGRATLRSRDRNLLVTGNRDDKEILSTSE
jgi:hypothetical protein